MVAFAVLLASFAIPGAGDPPTAELERVAVSGRGFVLLPSRTPFVPWGFNYDHDETGRLIEDYWIDEWPKIEADFREMKELGANVVRIHLQVARFLRSPTEANPDSLARLAKLLELAESVGLRIDLTGLGCYHKGDVPPWYDALDREGRWAAQVVFWKAVAQVGARSSAVFCYDLMNEPVVSGGDRPPGDWLGPGFGGKHFVQFITRTKPDGPRVRVAADWVERLVAAVRSVDPNHMITVGMVDWSLDRPGLTSGFVPSVAGAKLDILAVHVYPERDREAEALEVVRAFAAAGKPVVIEETFPLKTSPERFRRFLHDSKGSAAGWVGFYWGKTLAEAKAGKTIADAITASWLQIFVDEREEMTSPEARAEGDRPPGSLER
ncbi:MAG: cellulase family glycosylhydrolase [Isosphaeraceae bacterium]|nr:cellulase family glycosylhydrolase [Isosphaeraceae bacterium]